MADRPHLGRKARPFTTGLLLTRIRALWDAEWRNKREIKRITTNLQGGLAAGIVCGSPSAWLLLLMTRYGWGQEANGFNASRVIADPLTCRPIDILRAWTPERVQVLADAEEERTGTNPWMEYWANSVLLAGTETFEQRPPCWGDFSSIAIERQLHVDFLARLARNDLRPTLFMAPNIILPGELMVETPAGPAYPEHPVADLRDAYWFFEWLHDKRTRLNMALEIPGVYLSDKGNPSYGPRILRGAPC